MKYDIENLDIKLKNALQEFSVFSFGDDGYSVCAQKSDYNRTETNGKNTYRFLYEYGAFYLLFIDDTLILKKFTESAHKKRTPFAI